MKKLKIALTVFSCLISSYYIYTLACAGGDWDPTEGSMFAPEVINQPKCEPFFRSTYLPFYGNEYFYQNYNWTHNDINVEEWSNYFEQQISKEKLNFWLYKSTLPQVDNMILALKGKKALQDSLQTYTLANVKDVAVSTAFLFYIGFAKRNEKICVREIYTWYDENQKPAYTEDDIKKQIEGGTKLFSSAKNDFIKERYLFQLIRLHFFDNNFDAAIKLYETNSKLFKTGNTIKWRSMGYAAAAYKKKKDYAKANYYYSLLYANCSSLSQSAYLSFHPQSDNDWNTCLSLAKTEKEKIVLWQLFGLYFDAHKAIKEIYAINPKATENELLLTRLVNIEEEKFNGVIFLSNKEGDDDRIEYKANQEVLEIINSIAEKGNTSNPTLWNLAAAYLNFAGKNFKSGHNFLSKAEKGKGSSDLLNAQFHTIRLFGNLYASGEINEKTEKLLLPDIKVLFDTKTNNIKNSRYSFAQRWVRNNLAILYLDARKYLIADVINPGFRTHLYNDIGNIKEMIAYYDNPSNSEFEKFFITISPLGKRNYEELLGIRYAQEDKLDSALIVFKSISNHNNVLAGNPFTIRIKDCHDCDHAAKQKTKYNSISFVEKMIEMKNKAVTATDNKESVQNYFLVANGFYNMTYYGNARLFYMNAINGGSFYFKHQNKVNIEFECKLALKYYLLARDKSNDPEFKAKCTFMAAKCEQNDWFNTRVYEEGVDFKSGKYYRELVKSYSKTKYFDEIIKECSYFRQFATN